MNNKKMEKKQICIRLNPETYKILEQRRENRLLDTTHYIEYLILKDQDDLQSKRAAEALNKISGSVAYLSELSRVEPKIKPFITDVEEGVRELWQCLN